MYLEFIAGNKNYKLRLTTRAIVALERQIQCNPLSIFGKGDTLPPITVMVQVLHAAAQQYHHGITIDEAYGIFDAWLEDGHNITDFVAVIVELYKVSGLIGREATEKN